MKTLFVGGPEDGKRKDWDWNFRGPVLKVAHHPFYGDNSVSIDDAIVGMNVHTYQLKKLFRDETGKNYEVAFHSSITNPMEALIKGYHYHRKPNYGRTRRIPKVPQPYWAG